MAVLPQGTCVKRGANKEHECDQVEFAEDLKMPEARRRENRSQKSRRELAGD